MLSSLGAVLGIDVGCSTIRRSSAVCRIVWNAHEVAWRVDRFRAVEPERSETIVSVAGGLPLACAAFDGPLRRGFEGIGRYRTAERMLTRRLHRRIGKPGASSAPVGRLLNAHANACASAVLRHCDVAAANHTVRIDDSAVVEAFPSGFLGVMLDDPSSLGARRHNRSDLFFLRCCERGTFDRLVGHLLPRRSLVRSPTVLTDHDERAAFVCALTALCVAADDYTAVGDHDGWIILPPYALVQPWARDDLEANAATQSGAATLFRS
ncbi:MAG: hypothetical protein ACREU4_11930 [Burkholderiales bacterium]